ncbi:MAG: histidine phosphatase family protein [Lachnospiraceae bacterium]|nr:histidine phosphatase family protein [Lachnospiraceae bacterium]
MEKTTVIFVRHAQSLHPYSDDRTRPLTDEGMIDRRIVLDTLKNRQIDVFLSSPYQRSIDTIITTADSFGMKIKTDERFRERKSGTDASGMLERRWADFSFAEEGGENLESVQKRNIEALKEVLDLYKGKTVVIGTHGTALSCILNYYDRSFGVNDFLRIVNWMPFIVELIFDGETLTEKKELAHMEKAYQKIDFSVITACGECCTGCSKKVSGECPGCIEADGVVPEWAESGRCKIHKCAKEHGVQFCGLCREFPCERIPDLIPWNPDVISHLTYLKDEFERQQIPKRVYCGGRFDFDYQNEGYEQKAAEDYRAILLKDVGLLLRKSDSVRVSEKKVNAVHEFPAGVGFKKQEEL